jgi:hypothetical protein
MKRCFTFALSGFVLILSVGAPGCGPDRAQWMAQAERDQARAATQSFGDTDNVRQEARVASVALKNLDSVIPALSPQIALLTGGFDDIANSKTDDEFTEAVFAMCESDRQKAAGNVGSVLLLAMAKAKQNPLSTQPKNAQIIDYFSGLGSTLVNIPPKCDQASKALAEDASQAQQAEAQYQTNVNRALLVAGAIFAGAVVVESANLSRPPPTVQNNYFYGPTNP